MKRTNDVDYRWATAARWGVSVALYLGGCGLFPKIDPDIWAAVMFLLAIAVFFFLKWLADREQERRINAADLRQSIGQIYVAVLAFGGDVRSLGDC